MTSAPAIAMGVSPESCSRLAAGLAFSVLAHAAAIVAVQPAAVSFPPSRPLQVELRAMVAQPETVVATDARSDFSASGGTPRVTASSAAPDRAGSEGPRAAGLPLPGVPDRYFTSRELEKRAEPVFMVPLVYPEQAYRDRIRGKVLLKVFISARGEVDKVTVVEATPPGIFDEAALNAARPLKFSPAILAGRPVKSQKLLEVIFDPHQRNDAPPQS